MENYAKIFCTVLKHWTVEHNIEKRAFYLKNIVSGDQVGTKEVGIRKTRNEVEHFRIVCRFIRVQ